VFEQKPTSMQHLLIVEDEIGKRSLPLQSTTYSIGRDASSSIILHSSQISRQHAILLRTTVPENDGYLFRLIDGNLQGKRSTNGILVNGKPFTSYDLSHGDEILFGGEVRARYYTFVNPADIEFLTSCESQDMSGFLSIVQNSFDTIGLLTDEELKASNESALVRLASFPELFTYPIIEITLNRLITYLNPAAALQFPDINSLGFQHPLLENIIEQVKSTQKTFFIREIQVDQKFFEQSIHHISESDLIRIYIVDITERKQTKKALEQAYNSLEVRVQERTAELQQANKQLQREIDERKRSEEEVQFLQSITQAINNSSDFHEALHVALSMICEAENWEFGEAWLPNEDNTILRHGVAWCQDEQSLNVAKQLSQDFSFSLGVGLPGRVWATQEPEWLQHIGQQPEYIFLRPQMMLQAGLNTGIGIPIVAENQVIAVLVFFITEDCHRNNHKIKFISNIAIQIGALMYRKQAESSLNSSLKVNYALLQVMPDWIFHLSIDGKFINFTESKKISLPLLLNTFIGRHISDVLPQEIADSLMSCISRTIKFKEVQIIEYQLDKMSDCIDYEARIIGSTENKVIVIIRDITERKQAESAILKDLERERELNELKSQFVSMASHEFRTPLASILASAELLEHYRHRWTDEKNLTHLKRIESSVLHMTELLNDVLLIGQAEAGKIEFQPVQIKLIDFCKALVDEIQLTTSCHIIDFQISCKAEVIYADQKLLRHIINNLLSNAIKYSPKGGNIKFSLSCSMEGIVFEIEDSGIGIPKSEYPKIFHPFNRASNVGHISGTGLGLAIIKKAVDLHQGSISFVSHVGIGTVFTVNLPFNSSLDILGQHN
jgi:signal transduction histidine kinase